MGRKKAPLSWQGELKINEGAFLAGEPGGEIIPEEAPVEAPSEEPAGDTVALFQARQRAAIFEIRAKELEMALYLAKAKIAELELQQLKGNSSS